VAKLPKDHFCFELGRDLEEIVADANSTLLSDAAERLPIDDFIDTARWDELAPIEGGRPTQRWKRFFVGSMAHAWRQLTGSAPRRNPYSLFVEFVDAAWHSGEEMPNISWEQAIRSLPECIAEYSNYHRRIEERLQKAS